MRNLVRIVSIIALAGCTQGLNSGSVQLPASAYRETSNVRDAGTRQKIYAVNNQGNSVTAYRATANGNVSPSVTISGSNTLLNTPINIATDAKGRLLVTNLGSNSVTEYAANANGNATPTAVITCGGLNLPDGIALGGGSSPRKGSIYVANLQGDSISVFKHGANGCVGRTRGI